MKVTGIDYERLFSKGLNQYENERIGLHAEVDPETENISECFKELKATALSLHKEGLLIEESKAVAESEKPKEAEKPTLDEISSLFYVDKTGDKGPFKQTSKSDNPNNPAFQKLQNYLKEHNGFVVLHGFTFWTFSNNPDIIGRRKK
jgi:hypothetical protein